MKAFTLWSTLPRAFPYVRPYRRLAVLVTLLGFAGAAVALAEPWPLAILVDSVLGDRPAPGIIRAVFGGEPGVYSLLAFAVVLGFTFTFFTSAVSVFSDWVGAKLEQRMVLDLRSDLFAHCQSLSLTFHDGRLTGQLMNQINMQAAALGAIVLAFPPIFQAVLTLVGMFVVTALISWQIALVALVALPFIWWSLGLYGKRIVPRLQRVQGLEWQSLSIVHEAMSMLRVIVAFGRQDHEYRRFRKQGEVAVEERVRLTVWQTLFSLAVTSATALGTAAVLGFGAWSVLQGRITVGELLVLIAYVAAIYQPLEQISTTIGDLNDQFVQFNSSLDLLDAEQEVRDRPGAVDIGRGKGEVVFEGVGFSYTGRRDTLRDIGFTAPPGSRVAVVGPTGAGKTTLISLLIRFYDPEEGRILIDGVDIRDMTLECLRRQISVVLQEPLLFSGTIADNIRYGKLDAPMEEVVAAAKAANAHEFIERQPKGYETELGERGAQLSGGERQRIAVARAFIKDAPILILDEPTSSIDSKTEEVILDALEDLMEGRTSFIIAHRLSTVRDADLILVLKDGRIVEQGSHDDLVEAAGLYRQLHEAQTRQRRRRRERHEVVQHAASAARQGRFAVVDGVVHRNGSDGAWPDDGEEDGEAAAGDFDALGADPDGGAAREARQAALAAGDFDALEASRGDARTEPPPVSTTGERPEDGPPPRGGPVVAAAGARARRLTEGIRPAAQQWSARARKQRDANRADRKRRLARWHGGNGDGVPVDLNRAGFEDLARVRGIGAAGARAIIQEREAAGPFWSVGGLRRVDGFDEGRILRVWPHVRVESRAPAEAGEAAHR